MLTYLEVVIVQCERRKDLGAVSCCSRVGVLFDRVHRDGVGNGLDETRLLRSDEDAEAGPTRQSAWESRLKALEHSLAHPRRTLLFLPDPAKLLDKLDRQLLLSQVGASLDNHGDDVPVGQMTVGRSGANTSSLAGKRFGEDGACK